MMKMTIKEFQDICVEDIADKYIEGPTLVKNGMDHPDAKYIWGITNDQNRDRLDVYFSLTLSDGEKRRVFVNVEAQGRFNPGYSKVRRGIFYGSCMIVDQYGREFMNSEYDKIQKIQSIWICTDPPAKFANTFTRYHICADMIIGEYKEEENNYDLFDVVVVDLGGKVNDRYEGVFELFDCLLSKDEETKEERIRILKEKYNIRIDEDLRGAMEDMCTLGESIYYEGKAEGKVEGATQNAVMFIRNLMRTMGLSAKEAMKQLDVPEEEQAKYEELLKK